ncbi:MAG: HAD family hydrolase [Thermodesulfobacteriota bacterium]
MGSKTDKDSTSTRVIVFDLGNVLLPFDWERSIQGLQKIDRGAAQRVERVVDSDVMLAYEKGSVSTGEFYRRAVEMLEVTIPLPEFKRLFSDIFTANDDLIALLPHLCERYKLFLLSNTCEMHIEWIEKRFSLLHHFDELILSHQVGHVKPEREIFDTVLARSGLTPEKHFYVDDIFHYTEVAKGLGFQAHHFQSQGGLLKELEVRGII